MLHQTPPGDREQGIYVGGGESTLRLGLRSEKAAVLVMIPPLSGGSEVSYEYSQDFPYWESSGSMGNPNKIAA